MTERFSSKEMDKKTKACFGKNGVWYVTALQGRGSWYGSAYVPGGHKQPEGSKLSDVKVWCKTEQEAKKKLFKALSGLEALAGATLTFVEEDDEGDVHQTYTVQVGLHEEKK